MAATNSQILEEVREIAKQGRENTTELKLLRRELGLEPNGHGRLPVVETDVARQLLRLEKIEGRVLLLEKSGSMSEGKDNFLRILFSLLGGSAGAGMIGLLAHAVGFRW